MGLVSRDDDTDFHDSHYRRLAMVQFVFTARYLSASRTGVWFLIGSNKNITATFILVARGQHSIGQGSVLPTKQAQAFFVWLQEP